MIFGLAFFLDRTKKNEFVAMKKKSIDEFAPLPLRIFFDDSFLFFVRHLSQER